MRISSCSINLSFFALASRLLTAEVHSEVVECPVPPRQSAYWPEARTALASHPRAGSTWLRYLIEHSTGLPCGAERHGWANILPHTGGMPNPDYPNKDGVLTKTHSTCHGCWPGAPVHEERFTISLNSSKYSKEHLEKRVGKYYVREIEQNGACLFFPPATFDTHLHALSRVKNSREAWNKHEQLELDVTPCNFQYEKAVILVRDPLDTVKSNYHYRTAVLGMRAQGTWADKNFGFPFERGDAFVNFYRSWRRFAEFNPTITVKYEDLKADTARELRRIFAFLELDVRDEMIECAMKASTVDKLRETPEVNPAAKNVKADMFFGSRNKTLEREELFYPEELFDRWEEVGFFEMRELYGYGGRPARSDGEGKQDL